MPNAAPDGAAVVRIDDVLGSESRLRTLASHTLDSRMDHERWTTVLKLELLLLFRWAVSRHLRAQRSNELSSHVDPNTRALVLLPSYGAAVHLLRRAVPLALLGVNTVVSVPAQYMQEAHRILQSLSAELRLSDVVTLSREPPELLVHRAELAGEQIMFTGRSVTFRRIRSEHPGATLYGATGTCSVAVGDNLDATRSLRRHLEANRLPQSCSNCGASFLVEGAPDGSVVRARNLQTGEMVEDFSRVIRSIHPSVILTPNRTPIAKVIAGYTVLECDHAGRPLSRDGFARDPICGWPGDYCI
ncbi:hypothetical protein IQ17_07310 [Bradyrhizobium daqingense]|uniref:Uncharacterized protein n=1 Tax=Bradyrhizobium daqingense TaxID=993502 RepID=A0A562K8X0_9BRAD|nr:hypothetical protein IQ17_07310 [Bradyrhizobium daqingense]